MTTADSRADSGICVAGARKAFGSHHLWNDLSFEVAPGRMAAIQGRSGSGKSTLLNAIGGIERLDAGRITVAGQCVTSMGARRRRRLRREVLGFVFQSYALIENSTVRDNLAVVYGTPWAGRSHAAEMKFALDRVGLDGFMSRRVRELSGGEQQRVALARLLLKKPSVILADEPTGSLDEDNTCGVIDLLREMSQRGSAVLIVTHDDKVAAVCDDVLNLDAVAPAVSGGR